MAEYLMQMRPIGYLSSVFHFKNGTPRQPSLCRAAQGSLTVDKSIFNNPEHALEGLEQFSHAWIMFVFHKNQPGHTKAKVKPPRLNGKRVGVFSTRSPHRPNAIGLTLAKIERITGATVHFSGIDIIDGTPVLDIKPFIPQYDVPECRGDSSIQGLRAGGDAENSGTSLEGSVSGGADSMSSHLLSSDPHCHDVTSHEMEGRDLGDAEFERVCTTTVGSGHDDCDDDVKKTDEARECDHVDTLFVITPVSVLNLENEPVSGESKGGSRSKTWVVSSDSSSTHNHEHQRNVQSVTVFDKSDEQAGHSQGIAMEAFAVEDQEQSPNANSSQPPAKKGDCSSPKTTVAGWLSAPPVTKLSVSFTPNAEAQLQKFKPQNAPDTGHEYSLKFLSGVEDIRTAIISVLAEDPRSVYRREKCCDSLYFFTVDQVHVTCWFDDKGNRAEVVQVQPVSFVEKLRV